MRPKPVYRVSEVAHIVGCSLQKVYRAIESGDLEATKAPPTTSNGRPLYQIPHDDLVHYFEVSEQEPADHEWAHSSRSSQPFLHARRHAWIHDSRTRYTTGEVASIVGFCVRTVSKWCDEGLLRSFKLPGSRDRRIRKSDLLEFCLHYGLFYEDEIIHHHQ